MSLDFNHILFPTDFSENAQKALPFALEIARRADATITIMHVIQEPYDFAPMVEEVKRNTTKKVERLLQDMIDGVRKKEEYQGLKIESVIRTGSTVYSILEESRDLDADLIVMGTKGATGMKKILFGSITSEIVLQSGIPVLAIPQHSEYWDIDHITFTTDYHDGDLEALKEIAGLAQLFDSKITVLHVAPERNLKEEIQYRGFREWAGEEIDFTETEIAYELMVKKDFYTGLSDYLNDQTTQLITMIRYKKPFFHSLLEKDHTKQMGFYTKVPLLVLPGEEAR